MYSIRVHSIEELDAAAKKLLDEFNNERFFAFWGEMGVGKTTFIKALCRLMGSTDNITSPTFALINKYDTPSRGSIYHFDFYRINNIEEALDIGIEDYFFGKNYCLIEWPELIAELLPDSVVKVSMLEDNDGSRLIVASKI